MSISFIVRFHSSGKALPFSLPADVTVLDVKRKLVATAQQPGGALFFDGKALGDDKTLSELGLTEECVLEYHEATSDTIALSSSCEISAFDFARSKDDFLVMVSMKAPLMEDVQRVPVDLVLVVDRSGSMRGRMQLVIQTIEFVLTQMQAEDRVSLVEYDTVVGVLLPLTRMDADGKQSASRAAHTLTPRGGTNLSGGLFAGLDVLRQRKVSESNEVSSVLLFTDGRANEGITDQRQIIKGMQDPSSIPTLGRRSNDRLFRRSRPTPRQALPPMLPAPSGPPCLTIGNRTLLPQPKKKTLNAERRGSKKRLKKRVSKKRVSTKPVTAQPTTDWTVFVDGDSAVLQHVEKVTFYLDAKLFKDHEVVVTQPPFQVSRQGNAVFDVEAVVVWRMGTATSVTHLLNFDTAEHSRVVTFRSITLPPSAPPAQALAAVPVPPAAPSPSSGSLDTFTVNTFGFGASHNEEFLRTIASAGKGLYFFIENGEAIAEAFVDCIGGLLSIVGQNLQLTLEPTLGVELVDVFTEYPKTRSSNGLTISIKDIQSEEHRDLICQLKLPKLPSASVDPPQHLVTATLTYDNVISHGSDTAVTKVMVSRPATDSAELANAVDNLQLDKQHNRIKAAKALDEAAVLGDAGELAKARELIATVSASVNASPTGGDVYCQNLVKGLQESVADMRDVSMYRTKGRKAMKSKQSAHYGQRSTPQVQGYANKKKTAMKSAYQAWKK